MAVYDIPNYPVFSPLSGLGQMMRDYYGYKDGKEKAELQAKYNAQMLGYQEANAKATQNYQKAALAETASNNKATQDLQFTQAANQWEASQDLADYRTEAARIEAEKQKWIMDPKNPDNIYRRMGADLLAQQARGQYNTNVWGNTTNSIMQQIGQAGYGYGYGATPPPPAQGEIDYSLFAPAPAFGGTNGLVPTGVVNAQDAQFGSDQPLVQPQLPPANTRAGRNNSTGAPIGFTLGDSNTAGLNRRNARH